MTCEESKKRFFEIFFLLFLISGFSDRVPALLGRCAGLFTEEYSGGLMRIFTGSE